MRLLALAAASLALTPHVSAQQPVPEWTLMRELRVGSLDGSDALGAIGDIVVSQRTGKVFVAEGSQRILVFDANGYRQDAFGRRGRGPGEFENLSHVYWSEGFIVATDGRSHQVSRFTEEGELIDARVVESRALPGVAQRARHSLRLEANTSWVWCDSR
jgi:hypothetical protein